MTYRIARNLSRDRDTWVLKVVGSADQRRGVPDLIICHQGLFIGAEMKLPGQRMSRIQEVECDRIVAAGGVAGVATCREDVDEMIRKALLREAVQ